MVVEQILDEIDVLIKKLSTPVSGAELADGWRAESKKKVRDYFKKLRRALKNKSALPALNVARSLDAWGVDGGALAEAASRISNAVRALE